jgi:catechol 2,3-dioxygenase-like lactoylglutathione lyase family enzyme
MTHDTVIPALAGSFEKPLNKLSPEQRAFAEAYLNNWDSLSVSDREKRANEVDNAQATLDFWEDKLNATNWWKLDNVRFDQAAMLLIGEDPHNTAMLLAGENRRRPNDLIPIDYENWYVTPEGGTGRITGDDYLFLKDAFEAEMHTSSDRNLGYWLTLAKTKQLTYHRWIDSWLKAQEIVAACQKESTATDVANANSNAPKAAPAESTAKGESNTQGNRPLQRQRFQETEILRVIGELGHSAIALPRNSKGKPGVKAEAREKLNFTVAVFDKAWERLRAQRKITDA